MTLCEDETHLHWPFCGTRWYGEGRYGPLVFALLHDPDVLLLDEP